jgi:uncharacterized protein YgiM (DUF1202 family)
MKRISLFVGLLAVLAMACGVQVSGDVLPTTEPTELPTVIGVLAVPTPAPLVLATVSNSGGLYLRSCAGTDCGVLAVLSDGDSVRLVGNPIVTEAMEVWQKVITADGVGYVDPQYIDTAQSNKTQ